MDSEVAGVDITLLNEEGTVGRSVSTIQRKCQNTEASLDLDQSIDINQEQERIIYSLKEYIFVVVKKLEERFSDNTNAVISSQQCFIENDYWGEENINSLAVAMPGGTINLTKLQEESPFMTRWFQRPRPTVCQGKETVNDVKAVISELLSANQAAYTLRSMLPEHAKLAALLRVIPMSTCSVERSFSFSTMGRIQSPVRNRLNHANIDALIRISIKERENQLRSGATWLNRQKNTILNR